METKDKTETAVDAGSVEGYVENSLPSLNEGDEIRVFTNHLIEGITDRGVYVIGFELFAPFSRSGVCGTVETGYSYILPEDLARINWPDLSLVVGDTVEIIRSGQTSAYRRITYTSPKYIVCETLLATKDVSDRESVFLRSTGANISNPNEHITYKDRLRLKKSG